LSAETKSLRTTVLEVLWLTATAQTTTVTTQDYCTQPSAVIGRSDVYIRPQQKTDDSDRHPNVNKFIHQMTPAVRYLISGGKRVYFCKGWGTWWYNHAIQ